MGRGTIFLHSNMNRSTVLWKIYGEMVDSTRFNIFKSKNKFGDPISFEVKDIDGKFWQLKISDSSSSAFYPIYVEDGKSFRKQQV